MVSLFLSIIDFFYLLLASDDKLTKTRDSRRKRGKSGRMWTTAALSSGRDEKRSPRGCLIHRADSYLSLTLLLI